MYASDLKHPSSALQEKLESLYALNREKKIDLAFRPPYLALLEKFGNPHLHLPPTVHVAGTNGKGSIIAMLQAILEAAGYRVHAYTSPHLIKFNERIVLARQEIDDTYLEDLIDQALACNNGGPVTFFEITTAIAFKAFADVPADILLLETGMGGRLDCTNVIEAPVATVISNISRDHAEFLGETLPDIAAEKAGIMKEGVACVIARQNTEEVMTVFETRAASKGATLSRADAEWRIETAGDHMHFVYNTVDIILPRPNLSGLHQIHNAGAALAALEIIKGKWPVSQRQIIQGLTHIQWRARLQNITDDLPCTVPEGWQIWLDGGHNESAAKALHDQIRLWDKPVYLILGMMKHKEPEPFLKILQDGVAGVHLIPIPNEPQAIQPHEIKAALPESVPAQTHENFEDALEHLLRQNEPKGHILICGSLYLAGAILKICHNKAHNMPQ